MVVGGFFVSRGIVAGVASGPFPRGKGRGGNSPGDFPVELANPMRPDFGRTAQDDAEHRAGFPEPFFERVAARGDG